MVKKHGKKSRARTKKARTGAAYTSAAAGTTHLHEPLPDMSILTDLPYAAGRELDLDLAARLVAACRAACRPCQGTLAAQLRKDRATVAALAGAVYGTLPGGAGAFASQTTHQWKPTARAAHTSKDGTTALAAVEAMTTEQLSDLLEDALDHWAMGGADPDNLVEVITPEDLGMDPEDVAAALAPHAQVDFADDKAAYENRPGWGLADYALRPGFVEMPDGRPLPMLTLEPRSPEAGADDLALRCRWKPWHLDLDDFPAVDVNWRVRADIPSHTLEEVAHIDAEGFDDVALWHTETDAKVPDEWWQLMDVASHVLLCGPVTGATPEAVEAAAEAGKLLAVVARVSLH
ncbi:hypothetical protein [Streptomyces abikoensis]